MIIASDYVDYNTSITTRNFQLILQPGYPSDPSRVIRPDILPVHPRYSHLVHTHMVHTQDFHLDFADRRDMSAQRDLVQTSNLNTIWDWGTAYLASHHRSGRVHFPIKSDTIA